MTVGPMVRQTGLMPEPGSHRYEVERNRLRGELEDDGLPDQRADEEANRRLRGPTPHPSSSMETDRALGPLGENPDPGDPGNIMKLRSSAFNDYAFIEPRHAKDGGNQPPELEWSPAPEGTRELVLLVEDPDAPSGAFLHWLVTGIDPNATALDPARPMGTQHENGSASAGTAARCHRQGTTPIVTCFGSTHWPNPSPPRTPRTRTASVPGSTSTRSGPSRGCTSAEPLSRNTPRALPAMSAGPAVVALTGAGAWILGRGPARGRHPVTAWPIGHGDGQAGTSPGSIDASDGARRRTMPSVTRTPNTNPPT